MIPCPFCNAPSNEVKNHIDDHIISCPNCGSLAYKKNIQIYNSETKAKAAIACAIITCLSKGKTIEIQNTNNNIYLNNKSIDDFEPNVLSQKTILTLLCLTKISLKKDFIELNNHNLGPFGARNSEERKQIINELSQKKYITISMGNNVQLTDTAIYIIKPYLKLLQLIKDSSYLHIFDDLSKYEINLENLCNIEKSPKQKKDDRVIQCEPSIDFLNLIQKRITTKLNSNDTKIIIDILTLNNKSDWVKGIVCDKSSKKICRLNVYFSKSPKDIIITDIHYTSIKAPENKDDSIEDEEQLLENEHNINNDDSTESKAKDNSIDADNKDAKPNTHDSQLNSPVKPEQGNSETNPVNSPSDSPRIGDGAATIKSESEKMPVDSPSDNARKGEGTPNIERESTKSELQFNHYANVIADIFIKAGKLNITKEQKIKAEEIAKKEAEKKFENAKKDAEDKAESKKNKAEKTKNKAIENANKDAEDKFKNAKEDAEDKFENAKKEIEKEKNSKAKDKALKKAERVKKKMLKKAEKTKKITVEVEEEKAEKIKKIAVKEAEKEQKEAVAKAKREAKKEVKEKMKRDNDFSFALFGKWGTGKTFLINQIAKILEEQKYLTITVNCWKYKELPALWANLYEEIRETIELKYCWIKRNSILSEIKVNSFSLITHLIFIFSLVLLIQYKKITPIYSAPILILCYLFNNEKIYKALRSFLKYLTNISSFSSHSKLLGYQYNILQDIRKLIETCTQLNIKRPIKTFLYFQWLSLLTIVITSYIIYILSKVKSDHFIFCLATNIKDFMCRIHSVEIFNHPKFFNYYDLLIIISLIFSIAIAFWTMWIKNKKVLLIFDNLDRCPGNEMLDIIEHLTQLLDDPTIKKHVQIAMLIEEENLRVALAKKYLNVISSWNFQQQVPTDKGCTNYKDYKELYSPIVNENIEKFFICTFRLNELSGNDYDELVKSYSNEMGGIQTQEKNTTLPEHRELAPQGAGIPALQQPKPPASQQPEPPTPQQPVTPSPQETEPTALQEQEDNEDNKFLWEECEINVLTDYLKQEAENKSQRHVRSMMYKYLLARELINRLGIGQKITPKEIMDRFDAFYNKRAKIPNKKTGDNSQKENNPIIKKLDKIINMVA